MTKREFLDIVFALAPNEANKIMDAFDEYVDSNEPHWMPLPEPKGGDGMSENELKPCPFCGRTDSLHIVRYQSNGCWWAYVECTECLVTGPVGELKKDAIEAWNRRVTE